jgi:hypothetical protein
LPQLAAAEADWWLTEMPVFGGLKRQRIWTFWRRVLHTCHHRTQVQTWLRLAGQHVPAIYGPSGDVTWDEADPTYSVEATDGGHDDSMLHQPCRAFCCCLSSNLSALPNAPSRLGRNTFFTQSL